MTFEEGWLDYWNGDVSLYVSPAHLKAHYKKLLQDITPLLPRQGLTVLDYGCGDALMAPGLRALGAHVLLYDGASARRQRLKNRFSHYDGIDVLDDPSAAEGRCDVVLLISVLQYVPKDGLQNLLKDLRSLLKPGGLLVIGDILGPGNSVAADAGALLRFGLQEGFFLEAVTGLARTLTSDYRKKRGQLGLSCYRLEDLTGALTLAGFQVQPLTRNIGHANHRRSLMARLVTRHEP
jgi:2-polyprenyl-3-methyl-5-hydroxy-6-metoxy-1,4-benzoquinol methylase